MVVRVPRVPWFVAGVCPSKETAQPRLLAAVIFGAACVLCYAPAHARLLPVTEQLVSPPVPWMEGAATDGRLFSLCHLTDRRSEVRTIDADGNTVGVPLQLDGNACRMATDGNGHWMLLQDAWSEGSWHLFARTYSPETASVGAAVMIGTTVGTAPVRDLVYAGNGVFFAVWTIGDDVYTGYYWPAHAYLQRLDLSGNKLGNPFRVPKEHFYGEYTPQLASNGNGLVAVALNYRTDVHDNGASGILRLFDSNGVALTDVIDLPAKFCGNSLYVLPRYLAMTGDGVVFAQLADDVYQYRSDGTLLSDRLTSGSCKWMCCPRMLAVSPNGRWVSIRPDWRPNSAFDVRAFNGDIIDSREHTVDDLYPFRSGIDQQIVAINEFGSISTVVRYGSQTKIARHCDSEDPACDRCPGFDDSIDADHDDIPDGCDRCVNVAGERDATSGRLLLSHSPYPNQRRANQVRLVLYAPLPAGTKLADLPVVERGMRIRIQGADGTSATQVVLEGGLRGPNRRAGWVTRPCGFRYKAGKGAPFGFKRVTVKDMSASHPDSVRVVVRADGDQYNVDERTMPLRAIIGFGDQTDAASCTELQFGTGECQTEHYFFSGEGRIFCERRE